MKKPILLALLALFISNISFGQEREKYSDLVREAWNLYETKDYKESGEKYSEAFKIPENKIREFDRYNAACSWALAKEIDSSFVQLFLISGKGSYMNYDHITTDSDLDNLHDDERWEEVLDLVKANKEIAEANYDKPLVAKLDSIFKDDQGLRRQYRDVEEEYGRNSEEIKALWKQIAQKDSLNLIKVRKILDTRGWLGEDIIGRNGNSTLFLVIQHADLEIQKKYLPMMREAVKKGNARASSLALLEDRVALRQGKKQIYGSQIGRDPETGEHYLSPLQDPDNVDQRRAAVGLGPLQDYISHWNMTWDVEKYKKELPELEKKLDK